MRPPGPTDVVALDQADAFSEPLVVIFAAFPEPQRHMVFRAQPDKARNLLRRIGVPIFVKTEHQVAIPRNWKTVVVITPAIALDDDQVIPIHFADGRGDRLV